MIPKELAQKVLGAALESGGDLAEIYLENQEMLRLTLDDGRLENPTQGRDTGAGVRVFSGEGAAYAYTDDLSETSLLESARAASAAARGTAHPRLTIDLTRRSSQLDFPVRRPFEELPASAKAGWLHEMDSAGRAYHPAVSQLWARYLQVRRQVWIYNSDGVWAEDDRSIIEFRCNVVAKRGDMLQEVHGGFGGQAGLELVDGHDPALMARETAEAAVRMLDSRPAPAGEMAVVVTKGWGGVLFHEACGHAMEADFITNGTSAYAGKIGQAVASPLITAVDDGTIPGRRGSGRFDDEGTPSQHTVLIENGVLREYMWDLAEARKAGHLSTGNGRRQSYQFMPMPRMTNTYIAAGPHDPEEILRSVKKGIFVKRLGGGQADFASGNFVFSVTEGYLIEDGHLTAPIRGATLVGTGPDVLKQIDMLGTDFELDPGMGTCGKLQEARVGVGQPTLRIPRLTVGGTQGIGAGMAGG